MRICAQLWLTLMDRVPKWWRKKTSQTMAKKRLNHHTIGRMLTAAAAATSNDEFKINWMHANLNVNIRTMHKRLLYSFVVKLFLLSSFSRLLFFSSRTAQSSFGNCQQTKKYCSLMQIIFQRSCRILLISSSLRSCCFSSLDHRYFSSSSSTEIERF